MNPDYILLPLALLCLWMPGVVVTSAEVREKLRQQVRRHDDGFASLLRNWVNWFDLARSVVGAWMLQRVVTAFSVGQDDLTTTILCIQMALLAIGVLIQTVWIGQKPLIIGPVFYLVGTILVACGAKVGCFGLILAFTCALMLRRLSFSFLFAPVCLAAFAMLFHRLGLMTIFGVVIFAAPAILAFASGQRIAYARRPVKSRQMGYVYGGAYIPDESAFQEDDDIPEKENVPMRNFTTTSPFIVPKSNGNPASASSSSNFPPQSQDRIHLKSKPTNISSAVRQL